MLKGGSIRKADYPVDDIFLDRWSPRSMTGEDIPAQDLMTIFEAARWAPSSYNNQPWRILYACRGSEHWPLFLDLLVPTNKVWAKNAAVLLLIVSKTTFDHNGKPSITHSFDTGAAWQNLALQGYMKGYVVHGMQGFDYDLARTALNIPDDFRIEAMVAIGKPAAKELFPDDLQARELPNDRKRLEHIICEGTFNFK